MWSLEDFGKGTRKRKLFAEILSAACLDISCTGHHGEADVRIASSLLSEEHMISS